MADVLRDRSDALNVPKLERDYASLDLAALGRKIRGRITEPVETRQIQ